mgnify:CR=1 FL=1
MTEKSFKKWNTITSLVVLAIATATYLLTIEPTVSFWDCGEFIASSYKLEVGHPPGNPTWQIFAKIFTLFVGPEHAAAAINACSAICSALTIYFLYLTIVFFARRLVSRKEYSVSYIIAICGSGEGINMNLNKHQIIRAALCWKPEIAHLARQHNNANVLCMGARVIGPGLCKDIICALAANTVNIGKGDFYALVVRNINTSYTSHSLFTSLLIFVSTA